MASLKRHEGWLFLDHSASPGIPAEVARKIGLDPKLVAEGKKAEMATLSCAHCPGTWLPRFERKRERYHCRICDHYICDTCKAESILPGYIHRTRYDKMNSAMAKSLIIP